MAIRTVLAASMILIGGCLSARAASPVPVTADAAVFNPRQPQAAVDEQGTIFVAFGAGEAIYCVASTDGGKSYGQPVKIGTLSRLALGMRRGPRIAAGHGVVVVSAISHEAGDLFSWRSSDGGKTWQGPLQVNDSPRDAREGMHAMAMGPSGNLFCTWLDLRSQKTEIYGARSTDGGQSWSENRKIYTSPSGSVCECCHPSVTFDSEGAVYVMWRNLVAGARDMYLSISHDGGETFAAAEQLGTESWKLNACPMDGGSLAVPRPGELVTIWRRDQQLYRTVAGKGSEEKQLGRGMQPWAVASPAGAWFTWISRRGGELWLLAPEARQPRRLADVAWEPVVAAPVVGSGPVVALWETGAGTETVIMSAVVGAP